MAQTFTPQAVDPQGGKGGNVFGSLKVTVTNVTIADNYPAGGYAVTPANVGLGNKIVFAVASQVAPLTAALGDTATASIGQIGYNTSTGKIQVFDGAGTEIAASTVLAGGVVQLVAFGY